MFSWRVRPGRVARRCVRQRFRGLTREGQRTTTGKIRPTSTASSTCGRVYWVSYSELLKSKTERGFLAWTPSFTQGSLTVCKHVSIGIASLLPNFPQEEDDEREPRSSRRDSVSEGLFGFSIGGGKSRNIQDASLSFVRSFLPLEPRRKVD